MDVLQLNWAGFDAAVEQIAASVDPATLTGVYGIPRGGLVLAVALSHRLGLPLVESVCASTLIVDDIRDSGATLEALRAGGLTGPVWVWATRQTEPEGYGAVLTGIGPSWVIFPWEDPERVAQDRQNYEDKER